jgi:NAD(P)-dependent dehydrogenase (short-subunit alcohol dehydrogenase family)
MSSIQSQFLNLTVHHTRYPAIDPQIALQESASDKVIFITGASGGIGQATAIAFAQAGAKAVYLTARSEKPLAETRARLREASPATQCAYTPCDVTDEEQVKAAVIDCVAKFGGIDAADANAGYLDRWQKIGDSDPASWWRSWEVNIKGSYHVIRSTLPYLIQSAKKRDRGIERRPSHPALLDRGAIAHPDGFRLSDLETRDQSPLRVRPCRPRRGGNKMFCNPSRGCGDRAWDEHAGRPAFAPY